MGLAQMRLVGGRRIRPSTVSEINAKTPYLPSLYRLKSEQDYRNKVFGQNERGLAIQENAVDLARKRAKTAEKLGYAGLGISGLTGLASAYPGLKDIGKDIVDFVNPTKETVSSAIETVGFPSMLPDFASEGISAALKFGGQIGSSLAEAFTGNIIDLDFEDIFDSIF